MLHYLLSVQSTDNSPAVQSRTRSQVTQQMLKQQAAAARMQGIPVQYLDAVKMAEGFMDAYPGMMQTAKEVAAGFGVAGLGVPMAANVMGVGAAVGVGIAVAPLQEAAVKVTRTVSEFAVGTAFVASQFFGVGEVLDVEAAVGEGFVVREGVVTSSVAARAMRGPGFFAERTRVAGEIEVGEKGIMSAPKVDDTVFRVWGDDAPAYGRSWTRTDPRVIEEYRDVAGLPDGNTGRFFSEGSLRNVEGITQRSALPLDGKVGGLDELVVPNPREQIELKRVLGINPKF